MTMTKDDVFALKKTVEDEYNDKVTVLKDELEERLKAIDIVHGLIGSTPQQVQKRSGTTIIKRRRIEEPQLDENITHSDIIRNIIAEIEGEFSLHDIRDKVNDINPFLDISRNVIHSVLNQQKDNEEIETVLVGSGRTPSLFKKVKIKKNLFE